MTLKVDFKKEAESAVARAWKALAAARERILRHPPVFHASRAIALAERRADWVRKLRLGGEYSGALGDFSPEDLGSLVAVVGSSSTGLWIRGGLNELCQKPFWESRKDSQSSFARKKTERQSVSQSKAQRFLLIFLFLCVLFF